MGVDRPWEDLHHRLYFLPPLREVESSLSNLSTDEVYIVSNPLAPTQFFTEGNMLVISQTIHVKISRNPNVIKMSSSELIVPLNKFKSTPIYSKNFEMCLLGLMRKCLELIHL